MDLNNGGFFKSRSITMIVINTIHLKSCLEQITSPDATASPGMNNSGKMLSRYHLKDLQPRFLRRLFLDETSP